MPITETLSLVLGGDARREIAVLVTNGAASWEVSLPRGETVVGRIAASGIRIDEASVSRAHAALRVDANDAVFVRDLGSHNGTRLNGDVIPDERPFRPGDALQIGPATLHVFIRTVEDAGRQVTPSELNLRLAAEIERAVRVGGTCLLWEVRIDESRASGMAGRVARSLRAGDTVAEAGPGRLHALLPNLREAPAAELATQVIADLAVAGVHARVGMASAPLDGDGVQAVLDAAREAADAAPAGDHQRLKDRLRAIDVGGGLELLVGDPAMARAFALLERLADSPLPVLITGETGSGKELAARLVHQRSPRRAGPFVAVNCGAIAPTMAEAELFGHARGAFTGAVQARAGYFETASGGTLFLDEVGELPPRIQTNLLRVLETQTVLRVGEVAPRKIDVRLVTATHRDLEGEVREGRFREDLYFRVVGAQVELLPLRARRLEILPLARAFLRLEAGPRAPSLSAEAEQALTSYPWPGNIRELRNAMRYVAGTCDEPVVRREHLPARMADASRGELEAPAERTERATVAPPRGVDAGGFRPIAEEVKRLESQRIAEALAAAGGNKTRAAALIAMPIRTFTEKIKQYGLDVPAGKRRP